VPIRAPDPSSSRTSLGFPERTRFQELTVSQLAKCVIVLASVGDDDRSLVRLFVREYHASRYREIPWPQGCNSFADPVAAPSTSDLFVLGYIWGSRGGNVVGLYRVVLPDGQAEKIHDARGITSPDERWSLSRLFGVSADGGSLMARRCVRTRYSDGTARATYSVCRFDLATQDLEELTPLPATFA
jgi:hypothetical protein